uniref:Tissue factor pathway inhibitor n=1 Tax=Rhipicephalus appendiculatus TaxID=34631 RepID=A0A131YUE9_RHIAP
MGLLFCGYALAIWIALVSGLNGNTATNEIGDSGPSTTDVGTIRNGASNGSLTFLPGPGGAFGNGAAVGVAPAKCMKPPKKGPCRARILLWFYDYNDKHCKLFAYGGCDGNSNQFNSEVKCQHECMPGKPKKRLCSLSPQIGWHNNKRKWVFNAVNGTCSRLPGRQFSKSANGFPSCKKCMARCSDLSVAAVCPSSSGTHLPGRVLERNPQPQNSPTTPERMLSPE